MPGSRFRLLHGQVAGSDYLNGVGNRSRYLNFKWEMGYLLPVSSDPPFEHEPGWT